MAYLKYWHLIFIQKTAQINFTSQLHYLYINNFILI